MILEIAHKYDEETVPTQEAFVKLTEKFENHSSKKKSCHFFCNYQLNFPQNLNRKSCQITLEEQEQHQDHQKKR